jgi:midasin
MIGFVNFTLSKKYPVLQRKALSVRDIINAIEFVSVCLPLVDGDGALAVYHAIQLVIMDGLCLGIDVAGDRQKQAIVNCCEEYTQMLIQSIYGNNIEQPQLKLVNTPQTIGVHPFYLPKQSPGQSSFAFDAETTLSNLHRLLRGFQLDKPLLIEGPPGVGKTSLVENLARISGRTLSRVNLSEQTDMMDLLGSEYPMV